MEFNISELFTYPVKMLFDNSFIETKHLQEIRMRSGRPLMVVYNGDSYFVQADGMLSIEPENFLLVNKIMLMETLQVFSSYSLYAYEDEIRQGFLTIPGGHRVGICGKVVLENNKVKTIKDISSINIRIAHQVVGCGNGIIEHLYSDSELKNTLIVSAPGNGKTTLLRDIIRQISDGTAGYRPMNVAVVDERSEIAAFYGGVPQNDVGIRTDVMDACPKYEGMMMLMRSMAPEVIAVDEIGQNKDYEALVQAMFCGVKIIATVHGSSYEDILNKPVLARLINEKIFERIVVLKSKRIEVVLDYYGKVLGRFND